MITVDCSAPTLYLEYDKCPGDKGSGKLTYSATYFCGETLNSHPGYELCYTTLSVKAHPVVKVFNCLRKEIVDYELPDTMSAFSYSFSLILEDVVACSE